ncbi:MAG: hypothetical protein BroJett003_25870 [Planctomycetota bacterium]|nr:MAG: hypothetical protein BroJett003_25870 [Planctomycetota bacterium]
MAMGRRKKQEQSSFWVATADGPKSGGHPFYELVNRLLEAEGFDRHVEALCAPFYADGIGRPSLAPALFFRLMLVGISRVWTASAASPGARPTLWPCGVFWVLHAVSKPA